MKKEEMDTEKVDVDNKVAQSKKPTRKFVKNKSAQRVELPYGDVIFVFLPGETKEVPGDFAIPTGRGLYEV